MVKKVNQNNDVDNTNNSEINPEALEKNKKEQDLQQNEPAADTLAQAKGEEKQDENPKVSEKGDEQQQTSAMDKKHEEETIAKTGLDLRAEQLFEAYEADVLYCVGDQYFLEDKYTKDYAEKTNKEIKIIKRNN